MIYIYVFPAIYIVQTEEKKTMTQEKEERGSKTKTEENLVERLHARVFKWPQKLIRVQHYTDELNILEYEIPKAKRRTASRITTTTSTTTTTTVTTTKR